jgi:acid phosphatase
LPLTPKTCRRNPSGKATPLAEISGLDGVIVGHGIARLGVGTVACLAVATAAAAIDGRAAPPAKGLGDIETIVVIYLENRSFDNLYGTFPGANGLTEASFEASVQVDRDGKQLQKLPPIWRQTPGGFEPDRDQPAPGNIPNRPFAIDDPEGYAHPLGEETRDLVHLFYQNQMQINGGRNDRFVADGDSGALVMGHYDGSKLALWGVAERYVLADNFFMGAFGGSFLNHVYLVCACIPKYPNADKSPAKDLVAELAEDGTSLKIAAGSPNSALEGPPIFVTPKATLTPKTDRTPEFYAVNTMQPPYQPSGVRPAPGGDKALADPTQSGALPPQTDPTIGDLLSARGISWAWYAGAWDAALADFQSARTIERFQPHHQPFNYFVNFAPGTPSRRDHLRDAGVGGVKFIDAIDAGILPQVSFYEPQGSLSEHAGYTDVLSGDRHAAEIIAHLEKSPQWPHMLVIVTYDENGGFWDHVAPPKGDPFGPGTRIPALIISPFAKTGTVDHTLYDTGSVLRFLTRRFDLPVLPGLARRDESIRAARGVTPGDLTNALDLRGSAP